MSFQGTQTIKTFFYLLYVWAHLAIDGPKNKKWFLKKYFECSLEEHPISDTLCEYLCSTIRQGHISNGSCSLEEKQIKVLPSFSLCHPPTASLTQPLNRIHTDGTQWNSSMQLEKQRGRKCVCVCDRDGDFICMFMSLCAIGAKMRFLASHSATCR